MSSTSTNVWTSEHIARSFSSTRLTSWELLSFLFPEIPLLCSTCTVPIRADRMHGITKQTSPEKSYLMVTQLFKKGNPSLLKFPSQFWSRIPLSSGLQTLSCCYVCFPRLLFLSPGSSNTYRENTLLQNTSIARVGVSRRKKSWLQPEDSFCTNRS